MQLPASIVLVLSFAPLAYSQPPTPTPRVERQETERQANPSKQDSRSTEQKPGPSPIAPGRETNTGAERTRDEASGDKKASPFEWWNTTLMTAFTGALVFITIWLGIISGNQNRTSHAIERAYITMSHTPPGVVFKHEGTPEQAIRVQVYVSNSGNTPAEVTEAVLDRLIVAALPLTPKYDRTPPLEAGFLVKDKGFYFERLWKVSDQQLADIRSGRIVLWILGYVDYLDRFDQRHRAGYARKFDPTLDAKYDRDDVPVKDRSNLPFETRPGFNYDRKRKKGEGIDWDRET